MKLLIFAFLAYLLYRLVKGVFGPRQEIDKGMNGGVIDEMVQDPYCETYIPRRDSVMRHIEGKEYFFCSTECASKFKSERGK